MMLRAEHLCSLPACFAAIPDPRRPQGRRQPLPTVLAIATATVLCGARGYKAIAQWAEDLSQQARARFRCRSRNGGYEVPVAPASATCSSVSIRAPLTAPCKTGTPSMAMPTKAWPSMARLCATPSMRRTVRPISSVPSVTKPAPATPKKSGSLGFPVALYSRKIS
jgi:hypothetical protein